MLGIRLLTIANFESTRSQQKPEIRQSPRNSSNNMVLKNGATNPKANPCFEGVLILDPTPSLTIVNGMQFQLSRKTVPNPSTMIKCFDYEFI